MDVGVDNPYANYAPLEFEEILKLNETLPYVNTEVAAAIMANYNDREFGGDEPCREDVVV